MLLCLAVAPRGQARGLPQPEAHWSAAERALAAEVQQAVQSRELNERLQRQQRHAQLQAITCRGEVRVVAALPRSEALASCVDLRFSAWCPGNVTPIRGQLTTWGGAEPGCSGAGAAITAPTCPIQDLRLVADAAQACR